MSNIYRGYHIEQQPQQLRSLTVYLARLIGLTVILLVAGFLARGSTLIMCPAIMTQRLTSDDVP